LIRSVNRLLRKSVKSQAVPLKAKRKSAG